MKAAFHSFRNLALHGDVLTKIVCTIGPATAKESVLKDLIRSGMSIARLNFSHGQQSEHLRHARMIRKVADEMNMHVGILCDLQGPKIRMGEIEPAKITLQEGDIIRVTPLNVLGNKDRISVLIPTLLEDLDKGDEIFINDGIVSLRVEEKETENLVCRVEAGGVIAPKKGCNIPSTKVSVEILTEKDEADIKFISEHIRPEYVAASFVGNSRDIIKIRGELNKHGSQHVKIVAKIERPMALKNIDDIIRVSDGVMVARGDLGVEIPAHEVPIAQKRITRKCNVYGKPVIIATQMLESMTTQARPTRAEASDVFNAVLDGCDAVMLSGETSVGQYPVQAVKTMRAIAQAAIPYLQIHNPDEFDSPKQGITETIGHSIFTLAREFHDIARTGKIVVLTETGYTACMVTKYRPTLPILALVGSERTARQMCLVWGVQSVYNGRLLSLARSQKYEALIKQMALAGHVGEDQIVILVHASVSSSIVNLYDVKELMKINNESE